MSTGRLPSLARRARRDVVVVALTLALVAIGARPTTAAVDAAVDPCFVNDAMVCVEVPDVRAEVLDDAMLILQQAGLAPEPPRDATPDRIVLAQRPGPGNLVRPGTVVRLDLVPIPLGPVGPIDPIDPVTTVTTPPTTTATTPPTTTPTTTSAPPTTTTTTASAPRTTSRPTTASSPASTTPRLTSPPSTGAATTTADASTSTTAGSTPRTGTSGPPAPTTAPGSAPPTRPGFDPVVFVARHVRGGAPVLVALAGSLLMRRRRRSWRRARRPGLPVVARFGAQGRLLGTSGGEGGLIARFAPRPPLDPGAPDDHDPE